VYRKEGTVVTSVNSKYKWFGVYSLSEKNRGWEEKVDSAAAQHIFKPFSRSEIPLLLWALVLYGNN
jgi:hypothetical protein